jgi:hypothetical protein
MTDPLELVTVLARDLVRIDSRSFLSNLAIAEAVEAALSGFTIERIDYADAAGVAKRVLAARRGGAAPAGWRWPATWTRCPTRAGRTIPGRGGWRAACCTAWAAPT